MRIWRFPAICVSSKDVVWAEHIVLTNDDMKAVNTEADPNHVAPTHSDATKLENGKMHTVLGKHSWNVIRLTK